VAESVLHAGEVDTLVDEPGRVRVTYLVWRVGERKPRVVDGRVPDPPPRVRAEGAVPVPAASVEANSRTGKITWPGLIPWSAMCSRTISGTA
jgi:hypothetical protein